MFGEKTIHHCLAVVVDRLGQAHRMWPAVEPPVGVRDLQSLEMRRQRVRLGNEHKLIDRLVQNQLGRVGFVQMKSGR